MNFDEYWNDGFNSYDDARDAAKDAWQEQQSKIDELQGWIDEALNTLCKLQYSSGERIYSEVGNILKGNKDEN